ncbi:TetR/AcrR family transcriptional regulator [Streptomyces sp. R302]|uniref:TetR family transcriptional regulator n=1 Tax=unclassified Streptomyces TaxID=2593676 RepID=UPI00145C61AF|nr:MULTISPECIES: TetR family transcriptional regulator [unclassified Streptomyces]NML49196.1 TetR/AcrR family transcriptional regulator [Streptomyces sp. R301]NML77523.1 TetR/AcrR family transcriptional regulator [Streptomyces sp. R302]
MAATETLTAERILEATEEVLRRYGPAKATVVDVARALGVSHGSVYRHFRTKAALREAVTERWLEGTITELRPYAEGTGPADERLTGWLTALFALKRNKAGGDPELMATFQVLIGENSAVVDRHVAHLVEQIAAIIASGIRDGIFTASDPEVTTTARAVFDATDRFHDPAHAADWSAPDIEAAFEAVVSLVLRALRRA